MPSGLYGGGRAAGLRDDEPAGGTWRAVASGFSYTPISQEGMKVVRARRRPRLSVTQSANMKPHLKRKGRRRGRGREVPPKCNVDTYDEVGWFQPPKTSKDMSTDIDVTLNPFMNGYREVAPHAYSGPGRGCSHHIHTIFTYSHHIHVFAPYSQEVRGAFSRIHTYSHTFIPIHTCECAKRPALDSRP